MTILAVETATSAAAVALADEAGLLASFEVRAGRRHAELLHPAVQVLLDTAGIELASLSAVAVDVGPGLFTGIRVGVAAAKGYAMALGIPVVGLTSLEILARGCAAAGVCGAVGVVDLRRGEVAWSAAALGEVGVDRRGRPDELVTDLAERLDRLGGRLVAAGDGALAYRELLIDSLGARIVVAGAELAVPPVASLALAAVTEIAEGRMLDPADVRAVYLRDADVRIGWSTRHDAPLSHGIVG